MLHTPEHLEVVATLAGRVIDVRILEAEAERELAKGLLEMSEAGVADADLSAASGLPVEQVRSLIASASAADLRTLAGIAG